MAFLSDLVSGRVLAKLSGHDKKVTAVALRSTAGASALAFTGSADGSVKLWRESAGAYSEALSVAQHSGSVLSLCAHPTGAHLVSVSEDNSWSLLDVDRGSSLLRVRSSEESETYSSGDLHPDGLILACGTNTAAVRLWDIREQKSVACLADAAGAPRSIGCLSFSQNGYLLAAGGSDGSCTIWDLRKLKSAMSLSSSSNTAVTSVAFDESGVYLAVGSESTVDISVVKEWSALASLHTHKKAVTGLAWGEHATFLLSASLDRTLKLQAFTK